MAEILPFRGFYYNPRSTDLSKVLSAPYDIISPQQQDELYETHPRNVVRLEFGKETDRYSSAATFLRSWIADGTLVQDTQPALYLVCQTFKEKSGDHIQRRGFVALCKLEEPEKKIILPHEKTFPKPKEDRLKLLSQTKAQFSPIFSLYVDRSEALKQIHKEIIHASSFLHGQF